jgi:hypothetical protein
MEIIKIETLDGTVARAAVRRMVGFLWVAGLAGWLDWRQLYHLIPEISILDVIS